MHIALLSTRGIDETTYWGGVHTHTKRLTDLLLRQGHQVTLITAQSEKQQELRLPTNLQIRSIPGGVGWRTDKEWLHHSRRVFSEVNGVMPVDHIFSEGDASRGIMQTAKTLDLPVTAFLHNFSIVNIYNTWKEITTFRSLLSFMSRTTPRLLFEMASVDFPFFRSCNNIVIGSHFNANLLHRYYRVAKKNLGIIHNWVETNVFKPDETSGQRFRKTLNLDHEPLVVLYVGAIWKPKGVRLALRAFDHFAETFSNSLLLFVGKGPDQDYLRELSGRLANARDKVRCLGQIPNSKLSEVYNSADIFLMPTLRIEVLSYSLIEAMACELPVIATKIGGNVEAVGDGGLLIPPNSVKALTKAMKSLAADSNKAMSLSRRARKRVLEYFSEEAAQHQIRSLLSQ